MPSEPRRPPGAAQPAQRQQLPFQPGQIIGHVPRDAVSGSTLTPLERQILEQGGAAEGEIPDLTETDIGRRIAKQITQARQAATVEQVEGTPIPANTPPIKIPKPIELQDLSAEEQAEVRRQLDSFREQAAYEDAGEAPEDISGIPGMREAYRTAAHGDTGLPPIEIVDDMASAKPQTIQQPTPTFDPRESVMQGHPGPRIAKSSDPDWHNQPSAPQATSPPPPPPPPKDPGGFDPTEPPEDTGDGPEGQQPEQQHKRHQEQAGGQNVHPTHCGRCGWKLDDQVSEPSVHDKLAYVQTVLGEGRFRKEYMIFDRRIVFILRSLLPSELDLAQHQLAMDVQKGRIATAVEYDYRYNNYKLAMSIERLQRAGKAPMVLQPVGKLTFDHTKYETALPSLVTWFDENVYMSDTVRRLIGQEWMRFGKLFDHLESRAAEPSFWKGIEALI